MYSSLVCSHTIPLSLHTKQFQNKSNISTLIEEKRFIEKYLFFLPWLASIGWKQKIAF